MNPWISHDVTLAGRPDDALAAVLGHQDGTQSGDGDGCGTPGCWLTASWIDP